MVELTRSVPRDPRDGEPSLFVILGDRSFRVPLVPGEMTIGRDDDAGLRLDDPSVSRKHATLVVERRRVVVRDLGSRNGVVVNGTRIDGERALVARDVVEIGAAVIIVQSSLASRSAIEPETFTVGEHRVIAVEPAMRRIFELLRRLARADLAVTITGETGTGKEVAAVALHAWSPRAAARLVALNCAALPEHLVESELFGYEKGAFSGATTAKPGMFESAHGGTLFLDEIGDMPLAMQVKLLRALETKRVMRVGDTRERTVDVRIVAATHRDLAAEVAAGRFRRDLLFRLGTAAVCLPPLRERPAELRLLAETFLVAAARKLGRASPTLSPALWSRLDAHDWPGNIRELKNLADYLVAIADGDDAVVTIDHLPATFAAPRSPVALDGATLEADVRRFERERIAAALATTAGNQTKAAKLVGMARRTFATKVKQYGLG